MFTTFKSFSLFIIISCLLITSCSSQETPVEPTKEPEPTATIEPTFTPKPTTTPTMVPTETPTPGPLSASDIFDTRSPAVAFIDTPLGTGSGVLIDDGYLLTNAHVIWPYEEVRVVFPDGSEFLDAPILNVDLMADLAIIGPIDTEIVPLDLIDGEDQVIGSEVYLLGYPGEVEEFPQPTITSGLISRLREWEEIGITYFQSDAVIAGGQSGGILISEMGDVIGLSGFRFTEAGFALVASAADIAERADALIAGEDVSNLGEWRLSTKEPKDSSTIVLDNEWESAVFIIDEPVGTTIEVELSGGNDEAYFAFLNSYGYELDWGSANTAGVTSVTIEDEGPHFLLVYQNASRLHTYTLKSSHEISRLEEEDARVLIGLDEPVHEWLNYPGDIDKFQIFLNAGDRINIQVDSSLIDPYFSIFPEGLTWSQHSVTDDDSGGGVFGLNAELTYEAPETKFYDIIVESATGYEVGGYTITLFEPYEGAPTPIAPTATPRPFESEVGLMKLYENNEFKFSVEYPGEWVDVSSGHPFYDTCLQVDACFSDLYGLSIVLIVVEDPIGTNLEDFNTEEYIAFYKESIGGNDVIFTDEKTTETSDGQTIYILELEISDQLKAYRLIYSHHGAWINVTYIVPLEAAEDNLPIIEYSFNSLRTER